MRSGPRVGIQEQQPVRALFQRRRAQLLTRPYFARPPRFDGPAAQQLNTSVFVSDIRHNRVCAIVRAVVQHQQCKRLCVGQVGGGQQSAQTVADVRRLVAGRDQYKQPLVGTRWHQVRWQEGVVAQVPRHQSGKVQQQQGNQ